MHQLRGLDCFFLKVGNSAGQGFVAPLIFKEISIQEKSRGPLHPSPVCTGDIAGDAPLISAVLKLLLELSNIQLQLVRERNQILFFRKLTLSFKEEMMHFPKLALGAGGFGRFRGLLRKRMRISERIMPKDESELIPELSQKPGEHFGRSLAKGTLVVGVFDQSDDLTSRMTRQSGTHGMRRVKVILHVDCGNMRGLAHEHSPLVAIDVPSVGHQNECFI
jgi:hypothetical protein